MQEVAFPLRLKKSKEGRNQEFRRGYPSAKAESQTLWELLWLPQGHTSGWRRGDLSEGRGQGWSVRAAC